MTEQKRNQGNVRVIHGLEGDTVVGAVKVGICDQLLDSLEELEKTRQKGKSRVKRSSGRIKGELAFLRRLPPTRGHG